MIDDLVDYLHQAFFGCIRRRSFSW